MTPGYLYDAACIRHVPSPYAPSEIATYLRKIGHDDPLTAIKPDLETLRTLMLLHTITFPMDNTDLHYTKQHHMPVAPAELYDRMVLGSKGSYCFGHNGLLLGVLRGLGYRAFAGPARVLVGARNPKTEGEREYTSMSHLVLFVQPHPAPYDRITYLVDVGFGGTGPLRPILLADGAENNAQRTGQDGIFSGGWEWGSYPPEKHRLVPGSYMNSSLETEPGSRNPPLRDWHLQISHSVGTYEWQTLYTFTDKLEFLQWDIDAASLSVSTLPGAIFHKTIVCLHRFRVDLDPEHASRESTDGLEKMSWIGKWTLEADSAKKRIGADVLVEKVFKSEKERLEVIRDIFKIGVSVEDERWIIGREAQLDFKNTTT